MPVPALQSLATKSGKSLKTVEDLWSLAKERAAKAGRKEDFAYIMGILKRMLGLSEKFKSEDALLLAEALGPEFAERITEASLSGAVSGAARKAWERAEKGMRQNGDLRMFMEALSEAVEIIVSGRESPARFQSMVGIV